MKVSVPYGTVRWNDLSIFEIEEKRSNGEIKIIVDTYYHLV